MDTPSKGFRYASNAGILFLLLTTLLAFFYLPELYHAPSEFRIPVLALEFCSSLQEATQLFNHDRALIETYHRGHQLNMLILLTYAVLLIGTHIGISANPDGHRLLGLLGITTALMATCADFAENRLLMQLTRTLLDEGAAPDFWLLRLFVNIKFACLTLSVLCLTPYLWYQGLLGKLITLSTLPLSLFSLMTLSGFYAYSNALALNFFLTMVLLCIWLIYIRIRENNIVNQPNCVET